MLRYVCVMAWEPIEQWPGHKTHDSFRQASEPLVAERGSRSLFERFRGFWGSTDEDRASRLVHRIALTSNYVYVERADGSRVRTPRAALIAQQSVGSVVRYGVRRGDDFLLYARKDCNVQDALQEQLGNAGNPVEYGNVGLALLVAALVSPFSLFVFLLITFFNGEPVFAVGHTAQRALVFGISTPFLFGTLWLWLWLPFRLRVDTLGLHISRGFIPWLRWYVPIDELELEPVFQDAVFLLRVPRRFGSLFKRRKVTLDRRFADRRAAEQALREPRP